MKMWWAGHVARTGEYRGANSKILDEPEGNRPLARPKHIWEMILKWIGTWTGLF